MLNKIIQNMHEMLRNRHFWIISALVLAISIIYSFWPWNDGVADWSSFALFEFKYKAIGSLFIIPFIYTFLIYRWPSWLIVWFIGVTVIVQQLIQLNATLSFFAKITLSLLFPLMIAIIINFSSNWYKNKIQREIEHEVYMSQIIQAQENERLRIAQELHDGAIQQLLVIANLGRTLKSNFDKETMQEAMRDKVLDVIEDLRRLSRELRPSVLDTMGLVSASISIVDNFNSQCDTDISITISGKKKKLSSIVSITIFRIIQEALNNIRRHSEASVATVSLEYFPSFIMLNIQDNGCGFSMPETLGHFATENKLGLIGMRERVRLLNGSFVIRSGLGDGTSLKVKVKY